MEPSRSKRRRLMQFYIPPLRPDVPARFESLNDDTLTTVLEFVGDKSYATCAGINRRCKQVYVTTKGMTKETYLYGYAPLSIIIDRYNRISQFNVRRAVSKGVVFYNRKAVLEWALQERKTRLLRGICNVAGQGGRIDLLEEMWNNVDDEDDKEDVFRYVDRPAASHGKLNVLKWIETKGLVINKKWCAEEAARRAQLHIIQWLHEEKGFELFGGLYDEAIKGDHLHVMKWLREQEVDWEYLWTFGKAAEKGNLDILQFLHDEGCPWPDYYRVSEHELKPGVINWCRMNGYGNRIEDD